MKFRRPVFLEVTEMEEQVKVEAKGIYKQFNEENPITVLDNINFKAYNREFVSFVGPSGCGKTTLFNIIAGLLQPTYGSIKIDGKDNTGRVSDQIGYVLQKDLLLPWRTIEDNVILGLEVKGMKKREAREKAVDFFHNYKLDGYQKKYPGELSGGMKQRVALMRTMILDPQIILMDEAYKALDYPLKIELESELLETVRRHNSTVIYITHDIEEAVTLSDRVYIMKARPGEIVKEMKIDLGVDSLRMNERRASRNFNAYYETIWQSIGMAKAS